MKLISCYIEGYGQIKQKEYAFAKGITAFCEENGVGKTTLASFIKAMFYGLESYTSRSGDFCDRKHFYPFDGGRFGGNLTFEMEGATYKIERFFGEKSKKDDTLVVYKNGSVCTDFTDEIGKAVFKVDEASFMRTTFLSGEDLEIKSTASIHAQLNRFLEGGDEDGDLDGALEALDKAAKVYKKSKAGNDKITEETLRRDSLKEQIDNAQRIAQALEDKYARAAILQGEINGLNEEIVAAQSQNEKLALFTHYDSLLEDIERAKKNASAIAEHYPLGVPTLEETEMLNVDMVRGKSVQAMLGDKPFSAQEEEKLTRLQAMFGQGIPTEEEMLAVEKDIGNLTNRETEIKMLENRAFSERQGQLGQKFALSRPSKEVLSATANRVEEYKKAKAAHDEMPAFLLAKQEENKPSTKKYALLAALAAVLCALGGVGFLWNAILGIVALALGGVLLMTVGFLYLNGKAAAGQGSAQPLENPEKRKTELALREIEDSIKAVLMPYGYYSGNGIPFDFACLQADVAEYGRFVEEEQKKEERIGQVRVERQNLTQNLTAFFRRYDLSGDTYIKLLSDLRVRLNDYRDLTERKGQATKSRARLEEEARGISAKVETFCEKYGLRQVNIELINEDIRTFARLRKEIIDGEGKAAAYAAEKQLGDRVQGERVDLAALQESLTEKQRAYSTLDKEITADEMEAEKLEDFEAEKKDAEERLKVYKAKHKLLTDTITLLKRAAGNLRDKYVKPIKDEFLYYANLLEKTLGERVVMTKDFELRFERNGVERSEKHFSSGQRSICALCFRLALIKNMYREQLPFLVLDDPFTSLDNGHLTKVREVLHELANDMQMIYFTCHESRKM